MYLLVSWKTQPTDKEWHTFWSICFLWALKNTQIKTNTWTICQKTLEYIMPIPLSWKQTISSSATIKVLTAALIDLHNSSSNLCLIKIVLRKKWMLSIQNICFTYNKILGESGICLEIRASQTSHIISLELVHWKLSSMTQFVMI